MDEPECPVCEETLDIHNNTETYFENDDVTDSYSVANLHCMNKDCPLQDKEMNAFFDYDRIEIGGDTLNNKRIEEYKKKLQSKKVINEL